MLLLGAIVLILGYFFKLLVSRSGLRKLSERENLFKKLLVGMFSLAALSLFWGRFCCILYSDNRRRWERSSREDRVKAHDSKRKEGNDAGNGVPEFTNAGLVCVDFRGRVDRCLTVTQSHMCLGKITRIWPLMRICMISSLVHYVSIFQ